VGQNSAVGQSAAPRAATHHRAADPTAVPGATVSIILLLHLLHATLLASLMSTRPKVGVGVFVTSPSHPGCVLLGKRRGSAGAGTWALPGGHLEQGESWEECAARETLEETSLVVDRVRVATVLNVVDRETDYHYVVVFMAATAAAGAEPINAEPDKCEGWQWFDWHGELPSPLFRPLQECRELGFDPHRDCGALLQGGAAAASGLALPPYCCIILPEGPGGALLMEERQKAKVAMGKLTCFGGKREPSEAPLRCVLRECREELGWVPAAAPRRAVDLYVDGELIAWFYVADAPPRDIQPPLTFEEGRDGVWLAPGDEADPRMPPFWGPDPSTGRPACSFLPRLPLTRARPHCHAGAGVSDWHACVLGAWRRGEPRADFTTPRPADG